MRPADALGLVRPRPGWGDPAIWVALAAGPAFWLLAAGVGLESPAPGRPTAWQVIAALLWYPVLEELLFRGLLQGRLAAGAWGRRRWAGISAANVAASVAFTALHLAYQVSPWALGVMVPALVFGALRDRTASVYPAMLVHAGYNASLLGAGWLAGP